MTLPTKREIKLMGWTAAVLLAGLVGYHLFWDHVAFHQVLAYLNQQAAAAAPAQSGTPKPAEPQPAAPTPKADTAK